MSWFIVLARLAFDHEDTLTIVESERWEDAAAIVENQIREEGRREEDKDDPPDFYLNYVVQCDVIPKVVIHNP